MAARKPLNYGDDRLFAIATWKSGPKERFVVMQPSILQNALLFVVIEAPFELGLKEAFSTVCSSNSIALSRSLKTSEASRPPQFLLNPALVRSKWLIRIARG
jgi:hypothetical protein